MRNCLRTVGAALGFVFGKSCGWTGSARRTSGSDAFGCGIGEGAAATVGCVVGVIAIAGVGLAAFSIGKAWGAMIFSGAAVAAGETPTTWRGLGLRRWTSRIHFMTMNPTTKTTTPMTKGHE